MKGFISAPTPEQLQLTPEERSKLQALLDWQEASARSHYILGGSKFCESGHQNNPNNVCCWVCGAILR